MHDLVKGSLFAVQVAAITSAGVGPFSSPMLLDITGRPVSQRKETTLIEDENHFFHPNSIPDWLIYLVVPVVILISLMTLFYVRHLKHKTETSPTPLSQSVYQNTSLYSAQLSLNMYGDQKRWLPSDNDRNSSLSSARLLKQDQRLPNVYAEPNIPHPNDTAVPYATTALLTSSPASFHKVPWSKDPGVQVNWAAILPPPHSCSPPTSDPDIKYIVKGKSGEVIYTGSSSSQYDNMEKSDDQYGYPCDATTEHTYELYSHVLPDIKGDVIELR